MAKGDRTTRYIASYPPTDDVIGKYAYDELVKIFDWMRQPVVFELGYEELHEEPVKPFVGLTAYADGTDWNPGSGEGLYVYKSGGWTFIA